MSLRPAYAKFFLSQKENKGGRGREVKKEKKEEREIKRKRFYVVQKGKFVEV
jgi:hypothetical protein